MWPVMNNANFTATSEGLQAVNFKGTGESTTVRRGASCDNEETARKFKGCGDACNLWLVRPSRLGCSMLGWLAGTLEVAERRQGKHANISGNRAGWDQSSYELVITSARNAAAPGSLATTDNDVIGCCSR